MKFLLREWKVFTQMQKKDSHMVHDDIREEYLQTIKNIWIHQEVWRQTKKNFGSKSITVLYVLSLNLLFKAGAWNHGFTTAQPTQLSTISGSHGIELCGTFRFPYDQSDWGWKDVHMLVIRDHLMWYMQALVTSSQPAKCTPQALWDKFIVLCSLPRALSD